MPNMSIIFRLVQKLNEMRKMLHKQTYNLENMVDELRNVFSPKQIAKFLLFIELVNLISI